MRGSPATASVRSTSSAPHPHLLPEDYSASELRDLKTRIDDLGLRVSAITAFDGHPYWHFTAANPHHRQATIDHVKACADVAEALGAKVVQAITGMPMAQDVPFATAWEYAVTGLRAARARRRQRCT